MLSAGTNQPSVPGTEPLVLRGERKRFSIRPFQSWGLVLLVLALISTFSSRAATVTLNGAQTYQTISGFGVNANHRGWVNSELAPVIDALVDQGGMTLFRVIYDLADWETTNDNSDPLTMNWSYYNTIYSSPDFQAMWGLMAYLNQKGISNGLAMNFQGTGPAWMMNGAFLNPGYEAEWAETVGSVYAYARSNQHLQFSLAAPANEPDNTADPRHQGVLMTSSQYTNAMHALCQVMNANGLSDVRFVGPDLAYTSTSWLNTMMPDSLLMSKIGHVGLHSYEGSGSGSSGIYSFLAGSAHPNLDFWMTEFNYPCSSCESCVGGDNSWSTARDMASYLLYHLANGASAGVVWEGYDSYYRLGNCWSYWGLYAVSNINVTPKIYLPRKGFFTISQISKFVRPGAQRIAMTGSTSPLNVQAFYHPGAGQLMIVGVNSSSSASSFSGTLTNLPLVSSFDLYYTSANTNLYNSTTVSVNNRTFSATIPADCVFTLAGNSGLSVVLTNPPNGSTFSAPATLTLLASASTLAGTITSIQFLNGTNLLAEDTALPYSFVWTNVPQGVYSLSARASNSLGAVAVSTAVGVTVIGPLSQIQVSPSAALVPQYGSQQFAAQALDALGNSLSPQPPFSWSVSGGGTIDTNGLFTSAGVPGGPFALSAASGSVTGAASVSVTFNGKLFLPDQPDQVVNEQSQLVVTNSAASGATVPMLVTNSFTFNYSDRASLLAGGWSFIATTAAGATRNTEITNPANGAVISYDQADHPGILRIPCDSGDLWSSANNTRNSLFRPIPTNWSRLELALTFAPTTNYHQTHLGLYQDDNNYLQAGVAYSSFRGGRGMTLDLETNGNATVLNNVPTSATNFLFRLERAVGTPNLITGSASLDGTNWTTLGTASPSFTNSRVALWTGGSSGTQPPCDLRSFAVVVTNNMPAVLSYSLLIAPGGATIDTNGVIRWQPGEADGPGSVTFVTVVTDNESPPFSVTNRFSVVVNEFNTPPTLPPQTNQTLVGLQSLIATNTAEDGDIPANALSYRLTVAPAEASIDSSGVIRWTPQLSQVPSTNVFTTIATDDNPWATNSQQLSATNSFMVTVLPVHNGPSLPVQTDITILELSSLVLTNSALDSDLPPPGLSYALLDAPSGLDIDTNGVITWTPAEAQGPSTNIIRTAVTDGGVPPLSDTNTFFIVVQELNTPPVLPTLPQQTLTGLQPLLVTNTATDADLPVNDLTYQLLGSPAGAVIDGNGVITWNPSVNNVPSTNTFVTVVTDNNQAAINQQHLSTTNSFIVRVLSVHNGPSLPVQTDISVLELNSLAVTNNALDSDIPPLKLSYTLLDAPWGMDVDTNGVLTWTPTEAQGPSTNNITTVVTDAGDPPLSATNSLLIVVQESNAPPTLPTQPDQVLLAQQMLLVTNTSWDSDFPPNTLTYQLLDPPSGAAIDINGIIAWTPSSDQTPSTNSIITVVTDFNPWALNDQHLSTTNSFSVFVQAPLAIMNASLGDGVFTIVWGSALNHTYRVQYTENLSANDWQDLLPDVLATDSTASYSDTPGDAGARFYRVIMVSQ